MKSIHNKGNEHAVSETVGFIIIFGIILSGIGLVALYGYPTLLDAQQNANIRNMERNMISLQSDVKSLTYKGVPYKETTMQVSGGVLSIEDPDTVQYCFTIKDANNTPLIKYNDPNNNNSFPPGSIKYVSDSGEISIALQNGAVVKHQSNGSVMLSEPRWFFDDATNTLVINLIQINSPQPLSKTGISTVQMKIEPLPIDPGDEDNIVDITDPGSVKIEYRDFNWEFNTSWNNFFGTSESPPTITYSCDRVIIKAWNITVLNI